MAQRNLIEERRKKILSYLTEKGKADITELSTLLGATETTVRRDLVFLEKANLIIRTHGGAIPKEQKQSIWQTSLIYDRLEINKDLKTRIAKEASSLVHDNESLIIDGGSTTQIFASYLKEKRNILAVTNSPDIADILLPNPDSKVILIGGEILKDTHAVSGSDAENHLRQYYVDKCFLSVTGADPDVGCYAAIPDESSIKRLMIGHSRECVLLIDSSKFERKAFCISFGFDDVDYIVTDSNIRPEMAEKIRNKGIKLFIV